MAHSFQTFFCSSVRKKLSLERVCVTRVQLKEEVSAVIVAGVPEEYEQATPRQRHRGYRRVVRMKHVQICEMLLDCRAMLAITPVSRLARAQHAAAAHEAGQMCLLLPRRRS